LIIKVPLEVVEEEEDQDHPIHTQLLDRINKEDHLLKLCLEVAVAAVQDLLLAKVTVFQLLPPEHLQLEGPDSRDPRVRPHRLLITEEMAVL
jgi:hypothetical protein